MLKAEYVKPEITVKELSTALYAVTQKLDRTNKMLIQSQKELSEIYVNISHDLRSPVTAIRNTLEYLLSLEQVDTEEVIQTMKQMYQRVIYMEHMFNDMLLLSSVNSSNKVLQCEKVNIGFFLEDYFYSTDADIRYSKRRLILNVPERFPYMVSIDCRLIYRVLDNLFVNALKYSDEDASITLSADIRGDEVCITVTDTGFGIAKGHLDKVFERSYMVEKARTPAGASGFGLGLSIAKAIIDSHNGRIWCESELGKGSSFRFTLPLV